MNGRTLTLNYDENLDESSTPATSAHAVKLEGFGAGKRRRT